MATTQGDPDVRPFTAQVLEQVIEGYGEDPSYGRSIVIAVELTVDEWTALLDAIDPELLASQHVAALEDADDPIQRALGDDPDSYAGISGGEE